MPAPPPKFEPGGGIGFPLVTVVTAIASQSITGFSAVAALANASASKMVENIRIAKHVAVCPPVPSFLELGQRNRIQHLVRRRRIPRSGAHVPQGRRACQSRKYAVSLSSIYRCN